jgi:hypothetical protein
MNRGEIKEAFNYLLRENLTAMSLNQIDLVKSLQRQFKKRNYLSEAQIRVLADIRKYLK